MDMDFTYWVRYDLSTGGEYGIPAIMHVPVGPVAKMMRLAPSVWSDNALKPYSHV